MERGREGREGREKSRTPKEERRDKDKTKKAEKEKDVTKKDKKDSQQERREEEGQSLERKRLDFSTATASTASNVETVPMPQDKQDQQLAIAPEKDPKRHKKARFSDSEDESQESKKTATSTTSKTKVKSETPSMALTTQRLQEMTVSTPVRGDGTKTPLRIPPNEVQKHRKQSSQSDMTSEEDMEDIEGETPATLEEMGHMIQHVRKKMKQHQDDLTGKMHKLSEEMKEINYDVESHARINAHLLHGKLQEDARQASLVLSIEGFPRDATESDRKAFTDWVLQQANSKDRTSTTSLWNTRGELSTFINIQFSSGYHRNQVFQWFLEQFIYKKKKLYWWAMSMGKETNHEIRIRKALSEDARLRGRFVKAAMEAINEGNRNEVEFYPAWNENAVREKFGHDYLVWLHFSYASATCEVFVDEPFFEVVAEHFETKLTEISRNTKGGKGNGKNTERNRDYKKGSGKGLYASMDFTFDSKIPFWCKFIQVHNWRTNIQVQQALKDEEVAKERQDQLEG